MKITKDDEGKAIIDFEGLEIEVENSFDICAFNDLFDGKYVSEVRNGVWIGKQGVSEIKV